MRLFLMLLFVAVLTPATFAQLEVWGHERLHETNVKCKIYHAPGEAAEVTRDDHNVSSVTSGQGFVSQHSIEQVDRHGENVDTYGSCHVFDSIERSTAKLKAHVDYVAGAASNFGTDKAVNITSSRSRMVSKYRSTSLSIVRKTIEVRISVVMPDTDMLTSLNIHMMAGSQKVNGGPPFVQSDTVVHCQFINWYWKVWGWTKNENGNYEALPTRYLWGDPGETLTTTVTCHAEMWPGQENDFYLVVNDSPFWDSTHGLGIEANFGESFNTDVQADMEIELMSITLLPAA